MMLLWTTNTTAIIRNAQHRVHFLRVLRRNNLGQELLMIFYSSTVEILLPYCITEWYASCTKADGRGFQRIINAVQAIIHYLLPSLKDLYNSCCLSRAKNMAKDQSHPGVHLFDLLPSGWCYRCIKTQTNTHLRTGSSQSHNHIEFTHNFPHTYTHPPAHYPPIPSPPLISHTVYILLCA